MKRRKIYMSYHHNQTKKFAGGRIEKEEREDILEEEEVSVDGKAGGEGGTGNHTHYTSTTTTTIHFTYFHTFGHPMTSS
jgi:hypothetical protein